MNNAQIRISPEPENLKVFEEREAKLVKLIEALQNIERSSDWSSLKTELFDGLKERLTNQLLAEARKEPPNSALLLRLSGQLEWAERYADLGKLAEGYRRELTAIRIKLHGKPE